MSVRAQEKVLSIFYLIPFTFILIAFYFPLANLFLTGFSGAALKDILADSYYRSVFLFTVKQAFFSAFFSMLPGIAGAWIISNLDIPGRNVIRAVTSVPFVLPSILVVLGFVLLFGNSGIINTLAMKIFSLEKPPFMILYSFKAIILAHVFYNSPLFMRIVSSAWEKISADVIEAAESLGASKARVFFTAVIPQILPPVIAAFSLVFILCFMSFSIILVLGGGPKFTTVEVEIYRLARISFDFRAACSLAVLQSFVTFSFLFLYSLFQKKAASVFTGEARGEKTAVTSLQHKILVGLLILFLFLIIIMPMVMIIAESLKYKPSYTGESSFSLRWYRAIFSGMGLKPLKNSLLLSVLNTAVTVTVSLSALTFLKMKKSIFKASVETFFVLSIGISSIILSLAYMKAISDYTITLAPVLLLCALQSTLFLPLVFKSISVFYDRIDSTLIESAESIGAGKLRILLTLEIPLVKNGIITASVIAFALSMGEINSTLMLAPDNFTTIPVAVYRMIGSYNFSQACAMGTILIIVCSASFFVIDKSGRFEL